MRLALEAVEDLTQERLMEQLLLPHGAHEEQRPARRRRTRNWSRRRLISSAQWRSSRTITSGDRSTRHAMSCRTAFEEPHGVCRLRGERNLGSAQLRQQPDQLPAPDGPEAVEQGALGGQTGRPERVEPGAEGQDLLTLVTAPQERADGPGAPVPRRRRGPPPRAEPRGDSCRLRSPRRAVPPDTPPVTPSRASRGGGRSLPRGRRAGRRRTARRPRATGRVAGPPRWRRR